MSPIQSRLRLFASVSVERYRDSGDVRFRGRDLLGEGFLFLDVNSNLFVATSNGLGFINGEPSDVVPASVTLLNGQVTSFDFYYDAPFELAIFGGLHATYEAHADRTGTHIQATAVLASVPEPATLSLMLAGLLLTRVVQRSRKRRNSAAPWRRARQPASAFATT